MVDECQNTSSIAPLPKDGKFETKGGIVRRRRPGAESKQLEQAKQMLAAMSVSSYDYSITAPVEAGELDAHVTSERR